MPYQASPDLKNLRLLLVEDDYALRTVTKVLLQQWGLQVLEAATYEAGLMSALKDCPDVILADLRLPDGRGDKLCREMRRRGFVKPFVILTACGDLDTQIQGLECGADEFWTKPVPIRLFESRLRALLRRSIPSVGQQPTTLEINGVFIDLEKHLATLGGEPFPLNAKEFGILEALWLARGAPVSRSDLLARVWHYDYVPDSRTVDNYVVGLRKKLEPIPAEPRFLLTVPRVGYRLTLPDATTPEPDRPAAGS